MLTRSPIVKYLGLFIDQNLNWIPHVKSVSFHLARYTGLFYKLKLRIYQYGHYEIIVS